MSPPNKPLLEIGSCVELPLIRCSSVTSVGHRAEEQEARTTKRQGARSPLPSSRPAVQPSYAVNGARSTRRIVAPTGTTTSRSALSTATAAPAAPPTTAPAAAPVPPPTTLPRIAPAAAPTPTLAASLVPMPRDFRVCSTKVTSASSGRSSPLIATLTALRVMVPSLAALFGAGLSATIDSVTTEPAGITVRPSAASTAWPILAVKVSPGLLVFEVIEPAALASSVAPDSSRAGAAAGAGAGAGAGVTGAGAGAGAAARGVVRRGGGGGAGRNTVSVRTGAAGASFRATVESGAGSWMSRAALSAAAC